MIAVCPRVGSKKLLELIESLTNDFAGRIRIAHVVQANLKSFTLKSEDKGKIFPVFECRAIDLGPGYVGQRPNGLRRTNTEFREQSINRLDVFNRAAIGVIEHAEGKALVTGKSGHYVSEKPYGAVFQFKVTEAGEV